MYSFIRGNLRILTPNFVVLEASGVGYKIFIPSSTFGQLPEKDSDCLLHVSFVVREMLMALYGFLQPLERDLFDQLQNVSGIGPKSALSLIGNMGPGALQAAIHGEDSTALCKVPGIGKKTAERLIIELRDKIAYSPIELIVKDPQKEKIKDAMNALINLGYNHMTAQKALKKALKESEELELGALITQALKNV